MVHMLARGASRRLLRDAMTGAPPPARRHAAGAETSLTLERARAAARRAETEPASGARDSGLFGKRAEANLRDEPFESPAGAGAGADENDRNDANVASGVSAGSSDAKSLGEVRSRPVSRLGDADEAKAGSRPSSTQSRRPSTGARDASAAAGSGGSRSGSVAGSRPTTGGTRSLSRPATGERPK